MKDEIEIGSFKAQAVDVTEDTDVAAREFAKFNNCPHLCVEVPNEMSTISVRTKEGQKITFSFLPYKDGGAPQCVDIQHHTSKPRNRGGNESTGRKMPLQKVILFGHKKQDIIVKREDGYSITCVILDEQ